MFPVDVLKALYLENVYSVPIREFGPRLYSWYRTVFPW